MACISTDKSIKRISIKKEETKYHNYKTYNMDFLSIISPDGQFTSLGMVNLQCRIKVMVASQKLNVYIWKKSYHLLRDQLRLSFFPVI